MPATLADQARAGTPFRFTLVESDVADGVATLTINRPDAINALNEDVVAQLEEAFHAAAANPRSTASSSPAAARRSWRAPTSGASCATSKQALDDIAAFTKRGHELCFARSRPARRPSSRRSTASRSAEGPSWRSPVDVHRRDTEARSFGVSGDRHRHLSGSGRHATDDASGGPGPREMAGAVGTGDWR